MSELGPCSINFGYHRVAIHLAYYSQAHNCNTQASTIMTSRNSLEKSEVKVLDEEASHHEGVPQVLEIGTFRVLGLTSEDAVFYTNYPEEKRKSVFRKVRHPDTSRKVVRTDKTERLIVDSSLCWQRCT